MRHQPKRHSGERTIATLKKQEILRSKVSKLAGFIRLRSVAEGFLDPAKGDRSPEGEFMSLGIKLEQTSDVAVMRCSGRLVRGEALHFLKEAVTSLPGLRVMVLDLSEVEMLDGGGLGMLVFLHKWTRAAGIQLKLVNPSSLVLEMLVRTRLTSVLHVSSIDDVVEIFCNSDGTAENVDRAVA